MTSNEAPQPRGFRVVLPQRWGDMDAQSHLNNARFVDLMQEARTEFLMTCPDARMIDGGMVVVSNAVEFLAPVVWSAGPVEFTIVTTEVRAARFVVGYEMTVAGTLALRARSVMTPFDLESQRVRRLTPVEKAHLESVLVEAEPLREVAALGLGNDPFVYPLRVRWGDQDAYGHVNNARFYEYLQEARISHLERLLPGAMGQDSLWVVVRQDIDHLHQLRWRTEPIEIRVDVAAAGRTSMTIVSEVTDGQTVHARGRTVVVHTDRSGTPQPLPAAMSA